MEKIQKYAQAKFENGQVDYVEVTDEEAKEMDTPFIYSEKKEDYVPIKYTKNNKFFKLEVS